MKKSTRVISVILSLVMLLGMLPLMTFTSSAYDNSIRFNSNGTFKVMQISDVQDDENVEEQALSLLSKAIQNFQPDLVVFTGDNVTTGMTESKFKQSVDQFMAPVLASGARYAVTFGNHDSESKGLSSAYGRANQYAYYCSLSNKAVDFNVASTNDSTHVASGAIPIYNNAGTKVKFNIMPLDTGDYDSNGNYDGINSATESYIRTVSSELATLNDGNLVPTLVFQHIPVQEIYSTALELCNKTDAGAIQGTAAWSSSYYRLGLAGTTVMQGEMKEGPCPNAIDNNEYEILTNRSVCNCVGIFYGHDHTNSFVVKDTNNLVHGYCKSGGLNSYNDGNPGVRCFTINENGTYTTETKTITDLNTEGDHTYTHDDVSGTPSVPPVLYVGSASNSITTQEFGNTLQTQLLNHKTQAMYNADLSITFDVAKAATRPTVTTDGSVSVEYVSAAVGSTTTKYTWKITGGVAEAGESIQFKFDYTYNNKNYTQYAYSYVDNIKSPAGHYYFNRTYRGNNNSSNWLTQFGVATLLGETVYGRARAQTDATLRDYENNEVGLWTDATAGYYNYTGSSDSGFIKMNNTAYGLNFCSPSRTRLQTYYPRFKNAGASPRSDIFIDTSKVSNLSNADISFNTYRTDTNDHNVNSKITVYFKTGDTAYTESNYNTGTSSALSVSNNGGTLAATAKSNLNQKLSGSVPANGTSFTAYMDAYATYNGGDHDTEQHTITPFYLVFNTYTKGDLRTLLNQERAAMRQAADYGTTAFTRYTAAYRQAWLQINKPNTNQAAIDTAYADLANAIARINESDEASLPSNESYKCNATVASRIYVADKDNYSTAAQAQGTKVVTKIVNFKPKNGSLSTDYTTFKLTNVPAGATTPTCTVTCNNTPLDYSWDAASLTGKINSGDLAVGSTIQYTFEYLINGKSYKTYAASIVASAPGPSGWFDYIRKNHKNWLGIETGDTGSQEISVFVATEGLPADGFGFVHQRNTTNSNGNRNCGVNLTNFTGSGSQQVSGIGMGDWTEPSRAEESTWFCGSTGHDGSDNGTRAKFNLYIDTSLISNTSQLKLFYRATQIGNESDKDTTTEDTSYRWLVSGSKTVTTSASTSNISTNYVTFGTPTISNAQLGSDAGSYYTTNLTGTSLIPAGTYTYATKYNSTGGRDFSTYFIWEFVVQTSNKSSLRTLVGTEDNLFRQEGDGYTSASFQNYVNKLVAAKAVLANPAATTAQATTAYNNLQTAINNLAYLPADYTALKAKLAEIFVVDANGIPVTGSDGLYFYRPNPINDPTYYDRGEYYPQNYYRSTNEVDIPYNSIVNDIGWNKDIRYQAQIDALIDVLDIGWASVRLNNADYTECDRYLSYKTGLGANNALGGAKIRLNPNKYDLPEAKEYIDYTFYTVPTYQDWTDACEQATVNRSYKSPDQPIVDAFADALAVTYDALELDYADFTELDAIINDINENIGMTVEVKCPDDPSRNYSIAYYSPDITDEFDALIGMYDPDLYSVQQATVDDLTATLTALYQSLGQPGTLSEADCYFLDEQVSIPATYEDDYETYYTPASWETFDTMRSEYATYATLGYLTTADQESIVNKAAYDLMTARNNLQYNPANYSQVNLWLDRAAALDSNNYTNWSTMQTAIDAVVKGKLITEQAQVDTMAANLEAAYNGLILKDADYTALNAAITTANGKLEQSDLYTPGSVTNLQTALDSATTVKAHTPTYTILEQATVTTAADALTAAIDALEYKAANIQPLDEAIMVYSSLETFNYEEEYGANVLAAVNLAYEAANAVMTRYINGELDIRNDAEIAAAADALNTEIAKLPALYQSFTDAKAEIPTDLTVYTDESVAALNNFLASVNYNLKIADQDTVYEYVDTLYGLIDALEYKDANLNELIAQIERGIAKIGNNDPEWYTTDSYNAYVEAYNAAVDIRDADPAYTVMEQADVNDAAANLSAAIDGLTLKGADYTELNEAIATGDALDLDAYTQASVEESNIVQVLADAKEIPAGLSADEQGRIDEAAQALNAAIDALVLKPQSVTLVPAEGSSMVIDNDDGFIYGIPDRDIEDTTDVLDSLGELVGAEGYIVYEYSNNDGVIGTGTIARVYRKSDDALMAEYTFVIFGDNDGDGYITMADTTDATYFDALLDSVYDYEDLSIANVKAMDVNADGMIDQRDISIVTYYAAMLIDEIDQTGVGTVI